jgi:hypothetical protein
MAEDCLCSVPSRASGQIEAKRARCTLRPIKDYRVEDLVANVGGAEVCLLYSRLASFFCQSVGSVASLNSLAQPLGPLGHELGAIAPW